MRTRKAVIAALLLIMLGAGLLYHQANYQSLEEAVQTSNVPTDERYHTLDLEGDKLIFYGYEGNVSEALVEKTWLGYRWAIGIGYDQFDQQDVPVSYSFGNLASRQKEGEYTSFTYGILHDDSIDKLKIQYKGKPFKDATIVDTPQSLCQQPGAA